MEVFDFFDGIKNGDISDIEILNITKRLTNDFDHEFLRTLYNDLERYIDYSENEFLALLRKRYPDWAKYIKEEFTDKNLEVPTEKIPKLETLSKPKGDWEYHSVLNWKKIFWKEYLNEFLLLSNFKKLLENRIKPENPEPETKNTPFPCNESLEAFQYLRVNWKLAYQSKYAYIFKLLQREYGGLVLDNYTDWLKRYGIKNRIQPDKALSEDRIKDLREKYEEYLKQKK